MALNNNIFFSQGIDPSTAQLGTRAPHKFFSVEGGKFKSSEFITEEPQSYNCPH
jgi:hypothetical protein